MKPKEKKPDFVYRIIEKRTGESQGSYSRAFHDEYDFSSVDSARSANCHGIFKDTRQYGIAKYKVTYTLLDGDCDKSGPYLPPKPLDPIMQLFVNHHHREMNKWFERERSLSEC